MNKGKILKKLSNMMINSIKKENNVEKLYKKIELCSKFIYYFNLSYYIPELEGKINYIASKYNLIDKSENKKIMFFDSFGIPFRGLINQYIDGLIESKVDFIYVTYSNDNSFIHNKITESGNEVCIIDKGYKSLTTLFDKLSECSDLILYITPWEINGLVCAKVFKGKKYLINLTDHAYWMGASFIDYCIEFRRYGANVSFYKRNISADKILLLPYYPYNNFCEFQGYPSNGMNKNNTIFSGGSLYKTFDKKMTYYNMVETILRENLNIYFWYAGAGDTRYIKNLQKKFKGRVFYTNERADLVEILKHCKIYISTYPIIGGLMSQYCALAETPPITLLADECSSGILLKEGREAFEYSNVKNLLDDVSKLLTDDNYYVKRKEKLRELIISKEKFNVELNNIIFNQKTSFEFSIGEEIDLSDFVKSYEDKYSLSFILSFLLDKNRVFAFEFWYLLPVFLISKIIVKIKKEK